MQAIVITAYKNQEYLQRLINFFSKQYKVFIHIDAKSEFKPTDLKVNYNVKCFKKYKVEWGSLDHLLAILFLLHEVLKDKNINYIHIISGNDIPVRKIEEFNKFENSTKIYMDNMPASGNVMLMDRFNYGTRFPHASQKSFVVRLINKLYKFTHKPKTTLGKIKATDVYKGLVWMSLPRNALEYVIDYVNDSNFLDELYNVTIPEEFFFQTILMNSKFKKDIMSNHDYLVYNDWHVRNGSVPAILDETDYLKLKNSNFYFARKIDPKISAKLIDKISKINNF